MTNQQHPITPPPELVQQWLAEPEYVSGWSGKCKMLSITDFRFNNICAKAAQWGAHQELEACCEWLTGQSLHLDGSYLRAARRPAPSLKEQALAVIANSAICDHLSLLDEAILRRALEALPND